MDIRWLTAFIDLPTQRFDDGVAFWSTATDSEPSAARGDHQEFATLVPRTDGDPHVRVQRTDDGPGGVHLDLHVPTVATAVAEAEGVGASVVPGVDRAQGFVPMRSPGGMPFCVVAHHGEARPSEPVGEPAPNRLDQICIDVPSSGFDTEVAFWTDLTGWDGNVGRLDEFVALTRPSAIPLRILLQRLGDEDGTAGAHLDIACGDHIDAVAEAHRRLGAEVLGTWWYWATLRDPAGLRYCLTAREPHTGLLAPPSP